MKSTYFIGDIRSITDFANQFISSGNRIIQHSIFENNGGNGLDRAFVFFCIYEEEQDEIIQDPMVEKYIDKSKLSEFVERMDREFEKRLQEKTGWGRLVVLKIYRESVSKILHEVTK